MKKQKGITLIALIITIILMLILAGVVISLTLGKNGLFKTAQYAVTKTEEETAREKLELALADLQARKYTDDTYNENEYIDNYLINEEIPISENVAFVNGWRFEIDRTVPKIGQNLGKGKLESVAITTPYVGTTSFTTKISYVYNEEEIESYTYKIDGTEAKTITEKEYTTENELEAESTHTVQVVAKYKNNGKTIESNIVTIKTEPRTYLYNNGDECVDITGGWKAEAIGAGSYTNVIPTLNTKVDSNHLNAQVTRSSSSGKSGGSITISNQIDYTEYKYIKIIYTASLTRYKSDVTVDLTSNPISSKLFTKLCYNNAISSKTKISIDISQIEELNNIYIYLQAGAKTTANLNIYELWLEK